MAELSPPLSTNAEWNAWFLKQLVTAGLDLVAEPGNELPEERAGSGGHEIRSWLIGFAAAGRPMAWTSYEPITEWVTDVGIGAAFAVA